MPLFIPLIALVWLLVVAAAVVLCIAARRGDEQMARVELAPVIDFEAAALARRRSAA
jgi:hypothetical protein